MTKETAFGLNIMKDGSIKDAQILRGIEASCNEEALRLIQNMPKWNAGKHISPNTRLYVGIEHSVWNNKYGNKSGINQNDVSALVKYHF